MKKPYSDEERDLIMTLIRQKEDVETIAKITKRSGDAVRAFRRQYEWIRKEWRFKKVEILMKSKDQN